MIAPATTEQKRVLAMLSRCAQVGVTPSLRDVGRAMHIHFTRVHQHLHALYRKGYLRSPTTDGLYCDHVQDDKGAPLQNVE